ncbi:MAG: hypothetical protein U0232_20955 [Thermomicrobiales bacterium]
MSGERPPAIDPQLVQDFVRKAHGDLEGTKALLEQEPRLVNACWDWGSGDWETGLGGAAHLGNRPIAEYLIERGARVDIFAAAMLGQLAVVKALVAANPGIHRHPGPHGIPLARHAERGGEAAAAVLEYLRGLEES